MPGDIFLAKAGILGTAIAMVIAGLVMIIIALNYSYMINKYPVAGGEFVYTYKCFGQDHAFLCSWFLGLSYLAVVPLNATALALIGRNLLGNLFQVGFHYTVAGYDIYLGEILLAVGTLILFGILNIKGSKFAGSFQTLLAALLIGGVVIMILGALFSPDVSVNNLSPAFPPESNKLSSILAIVAVAPWAFVGFDTVPQAAEEFNFSPHKSKIIMIVAILFGAFVYIALNTVTAAVVPNGYSNWVEYIKNAPNQNGLLALPTFNAAHELLGNAGLLFLGLSVTAAILTGIVGFYMASSRLLYSMAKENVLPDWFGQLHEKYKTPHNAILFVMLLSIIAPFFGRTALSWIIDMSSTGAAIGYGYTSLAAMKLALQEKKTGIVITGVIGAILSLIFLILLLVPIKMFDCSLGRNSYICLILWIILGIIFYFRSKSKSKKNER